MRTELFRMNTIKVKTVRLICPLEENMKRDLNRIPDHQMKERIKIVNDELNQYNWPSYIHTVDTSNISTSEVLKKIESLD